MRGDNVAKLAHNHSFKAIYMPLLPSNGSVVVSFWGVATVVIAVVDSVSLLDEVGLEDT